LKGIEIQEAGRYENRRLPESLVDRKRAAETKRRKRTKDEVSREDK